jgi:hypothetical protein
MNKLTLILAGATCISALAFVACDKKVGKLPGENNGQGTTTSPPPPPVGFCDTITYNKHIKKIIAANCAIPTCHVPGGSGNGDFTSHSGVSAKVSSGMFKMRVFDPPAGDPSLMPPPANGGKLPQAQLDLIKCWMDKGAPND